MKQSILIKFLLFVAVTLSMTACYTYEQIGLLQEDNPNLPVYDSVPYIDYKIQVNDEIIYRLTTTTTEYQNVFSSNNQLSNNNNMFSYKVYTDGTIDLPFANKIHIEGLTIKEAEQEVERRMREVIPDATLKLTLFNKTFTVLGDIGNGTFQIYKDKMTIYQALAMTGLVQRSGDRQHVKILRQTDSGIKTLEFDMRPRSIINSEYYYIYPNDIIYVQRDAGSFYKVSTYTSFIGLISSSISFLLTVVYVAK